MDAVSLPRNWLYLHAIDPCCVPPPRCYHPLGNVRSRPQDISTSTACYSPSNYAATTFHLHACYTPRSHYMDSIMPASVSHRTRPTSTPHVKLLISAIILHIYASHSTCVQHLTSFRSQLFRIQVSHCAHAHCLHHVCSYISLLHRHHHMSLLSRHSRLVFVFSLCLSVCLSMPRNHWSSPHSSSSSSSSPSPSSS